MVSFVSGCVFCLFGFLLGQLAGLRTGPPPVLLWLSTSRQPFFFPPVWPIRTRLGPYNCVSSEKQECTRTRVVQKLRQIITKQRQTNNKKPPQPKTTRKSPSQICVSPQSKTAKQQGTGQGPTKPKNPFRFALDTVTLATVSSSKTCKLIIHCGSA